jgi:hypothetical protein
MFSVSINSAGPNSKTQGEVSKNRTVDTWTEACAIVNAQLAAINDGESAVFVSINRQGRTNASVSIAINPGGFAPVDADKAINEQEETEDENSTDSSSESDSDSDSGDAGSSPDQSSADDETSSESSDASETNQSSDDSNDGSDNSADSSTGDDTANNT